MLKRISGGALLLLLMTACAGVSQATAEGEPIVSADGIVLDSQSPAIQAGQETGDANAAIAPSGAAVPALTDTDASSTFSLAALMDASGCPTGAFIDVTATPQNAAYPDPELSVTCQGETMIVESNGIPNFEFIQVTPNALTEQDYRWEIPLNPVVAAQTTDIPLGGPAAITVTGLPIFGPTEAPQDGYRDPLLDSLLDYCNGHTAPGGVYHFHARPDCLFTNLEGNTALVIGWSFDGFPILAPYICEDTSCASVREVHSSYQMVNPNVDNAWDQHAYVEGQGDLDECNGMILSDGSYVYFATDSFPYFMGCYRGTVSNNNLLGGGQAPQAGTPAGQQGGQQTPLAGAQQQAAPTGNLPQPPQQGGPGQNRPPRR